MTIEQGYTWERQSLLLAQINFRMVLPERENGLLPETSPEQLPAEIQAFYGQAKDNAWLTFYQDAARHDQIKGCNHNQLKAAAGITVDIDECEREGKVFKGGLFGPMASGKDSVSHHLRWGTTCLGSLSERTQLVRHYFDLGRYPKTVCTQGGIEMGPVPTYGNLVDLAKQSESFKPGTLFIINEFIFATGDQNQPVTAENLASFLGKMEQKGIHTLFVGLDLDFKRDPWPNMALVLKEIDYIAVLSARCNEKGCNRTAHFTERRRPVVRTRGEDQQIIYVPCRMSDEVVKVGTVVKKEILLGADQYGSKCAKHHRVLPPLNK